MPDLRTRAEKLRAMADQDASPHEADIARAKLAEMGAGDREPPQRPPSAPAPGWFNGGIQYTATASGTNVWGNTVAWSPGAIFIEIREL